MSGDMVTTISIRRDLWESLLHKIYQENGTTHGVIGKTIIELIEKYIEKEKTGASMTKTSTYKLV